MKKRMSRREVLHAAGATGAGALLAGELRAQAPAAATAAVAEPARNTPVAHECDICVLGGSCTGVFAAVAAARLGARVAIVELNGFFGGVATASLVNLWHSTTDMTDRQQVIAGLTTEILQRLARRDAMMSVTSMNRQVHAINTEELKIELDALVTEAKVRPFLHAMFVAPVGEGGHMTAAIIEDKTGRRAIRASMFIDATGDADAVFRMGLPTYRRENVQPPTMCCILRGLKAIRAKRPDFNVNQAIFDTRYPQALRKGFSWGQAVPGAGDEYMLAGTRVFGADCSDADQLTAASIEGRRQVRAVCDLLREHFMDGKGVPLLTLPAKIGVRETRHARCLHTLTETELLSGQRFPDAIANGTYPVDIHNARGAGVTFRHLEKAPFYQIPYRSLVPQGARNVLVAGRCIDADEGAFGAVRVMVNTNQTGQAVGVAAYLALTSGRGVADVDVAALRDTLKKQGAAVV